jgi:hypothetical protein
MKETLDINLDAINDEKELKEIGKTYLLLAQYAQNKATAVRLRKEGNITVALAMEETCNNIYKLIPDNYKQW